jgi:hypothetical protein
MTQMLIAGAFDLCAFAFAGMCCAALAREQARWDSRWQR